MKQIVKTKLFADQIPETARFGDTIKLMYLTRIHNIDKSESLIVRHNFELIYGVHDIELDWNLRFVAWTPKYPLFEHKV